MPLKSIKGFGADFDIEVRRENERRRMTLLRDGTALYAKSLTEGNSLSCTLPWQAERKKSHEIDVVF